MNKHLKQVLQWQDILGRPDHIVPDEPICINEETMTTRMEFMYDALRKYSVANSTNSVKDVLGALIDLQYLLYGMVGIHGLQHVFDREFDKVHQANMEKLGPNVLKPKGWQRPILNVKNDSSPPQEPTLKKIATESLNHMSLRKDGKGEGYELLLHFSGGGVAIRIEETDSSQDVSKKLIHLAFLIERTIANRAETEEYVKE